MLYEMNSERRKLLVHKPPFPRSVGGPAEPYWVEQHRSEARILRASERHKVYWHRPPS